MHLHDEPSSEGETQAGITRVPMAALTHALAEIEARRARREFEQAGTLTLAEALQESGVEATPGEVAQEVERVRAADAEAAIKRKRRQRLRLILRAEIASALLCGLTLLALSQTLYSPHWQAAHQIDKAAHQIDKMSDALRLTRGPNPRYAIFAVRNVLSPTTASGSVGTAGGTWSNSPTYPLSALPDGYNIHHDESLDDDGYASLGNAPFMPTFPAYFQFREASRPSTHERVSVFYDGLRYDRGWIRRSDVPSLLHGRPFLYYPEPVDDPQDDHAGLVQLTLSSQSIATSQPASRFASATGYSYLVFMAGTPVPLDEHAWEKF